MRLEVEDLEAWIDNYKRYKNTIKRLDDEILEKETEINRFGGSVIRRPDGNADSKRISSRHWQLLGELDALMVDRDFFQNRINIIHQLSDWSMENDEGWHIVLQRKLETGKIYVEELKGINQRQQYREYKKILKNFLKVVILTRENVI